MFKVASTATVRYGWRGGYWAEVAASEDRAALGIWEPAELAGVIPASVWNIETGRHKARPSSRKLAAALQVRPHELTGPRTRGASASRRPSHRPPPSHGKGQP